MNNPIPKNDENNPVIVTYDSDYFYDSNCKTASTAINTDQRLQDAKDAVGNSLHYKNVPFNYN
ncbi:hypothetical protein [Scytonema sp. NUACC26]|uniref:hypothetical protein n=1 Tax=Scytonema sp. NUACC26 TaxID=3140176 RepID=UPI0034DC7044